MTVVRTTEEIRREAVEVVRLRLGPAAAIEHLASLVASLTLHCETKTDPEPLLTGDDAVDGHVPHRCTATVSAPLGVAEQLRDVAGRVRALEERYEREAAVNRVSHRIAEEQATRILQLQETEAWARQVHLRLSWNRSLSLGVCDCGLCALLASAPAALREEKKG